MNSVKIIISPKSIMALIAFVLLVIFIYHTKDVILLLFASFVIASALYPTVDWMSKKMRRGLAVGIVYLIGILILSVVSVPFFAILIDQIQEFIKDFPGYWSNVQALITKGEVLIESTGYIPDYSQAFTNLTSFSKDIVSQSINLTVNIVAGIIMSFTLAVLVLFLLLDKDEIKKGVLTLFPVECREKTEFIVATISKKVGGYVRGELLLMLTVGVVSSISLAVVGIEFAFLLGLVAGLLEIVPIVGPIIAAVPAVIVALSDNPWLALYVVVIYFIIHRVENVLLMPLILGRFLELHPIIIITAILMSASTLGVFGIILSPAIAASIYVLVQELYLNKIKAAEQVQEASV
jgi:predicted PurR-regulated permease PerM